MNETPPPPPNTRAGVSGFAGDDHQQLTMSKAVRWYAGTITDPDAARYAKWPGRTTTTDQRRGRAALWPSYSAAGRSARERCCRGIRSSSLVRNTTVESLVTSVDKVRKKVPSVLTWPLRRLVFGQIDIAISLPIVHLSG